MIPRFPSLVLIVAMALIGQISRGQQQGSTELKDLADWYFNLVQSEKFVETSDLFHYPPKYTEKQLSEDRSMVGQSIELLTREFGQIMSFQNVTMQDSSFQVGIGGGDIPYWQKNPISFKVLYNVVFDKEGDGFVDMDFCKINEAWQIRQVNYGLPPSRSDATSFVMNVMMKMSQLAPVVNEK